MFLCFADELCVVFLMACFGLLSSGFGCVETGCLWHGLDSWAFRSARLALENFHSMVRNDPKVKTCLMEGQGLSFFQLSSLLKAFLVIGV